VPEDTIRHALRALAEERGRAPTREEWNKEGRQRFGVPRTDTVARRFGMAWSEFVESCGVQPNASHVSLNKATPSGRRHGFDASRQMVSAGAAPRATRGTGDRTLDRYGRGR
jgi:hypothetical protein